MGMQVGYLHHNRPAAHCFFAYFICTFIAAKSHPGIEKSPSSLRWRAFYTIVYRGIPCGRIPVRAIAPCRQSEPVAEGCEFLQRQTLAADVCLQSHIGKSRFDPFSGHTLCCQGRIVLQRIHQGLPALCESCPDQTGMISAFIRPSLTGPVPFTVIVLLI